MNIWKEKTDDDRDYLKKVIKAFHSWVLESDEFIALEEQKKFVKIAMKNLYKRNK